MGALENMQEEIIPLVPALLLLGAGLRIDAVAVVAMSAGAAMVGSAFGPTNPFQAGIALKLAQLPPLSGGRAPARDVRRRRRAVDRLDDAVRAIERVQAVQRVQEVQQRFRRFDGSAVHSAPASPDLPSDRTIGARRHLLILALVLAPMAAYVYGALARLGIQRAVGRVHHRRARRGARRRLQPRRGP